MRHLEQIYIVKKIARTKLFCVYKLFLFFSSKSRANLVLKRNECSNYLKILKVSIKCTTRINMCNCLMQNVPNCKRYDTDVRGIKHRWSFLLKSISHTWLFKRLQQCAYDNTACGCRLKVVEALWLYWRFSALKAASGSQLCWRG